MRTTPSSRSTTSSANGVPRCMAMPRPKWASWYRFAPVETTQSRNPASSSGMIVDIPRPAGVIAPVRLIPTVTSSARMRSANSRQPSPSRPALYARNALSTSSAVVSLPVMGFGLMRGPRRNSLGVISSGVEGLIGAGAALPGFDDPAHHLSGVFGDPEQLQVLGGNLPFGRHAVPQPVGEPLPVGPAEQHDRELLHLARLHQRQRLEQLVHRAVPAGKHDERR